MDFRPDRRTTPTVIVDRAGEPTSPGRDGLPTDVRSSCRDGNAAVYELVVIDVATQQMRSVVARAGRSIDVRRRGHLTVARFCSPPNVGDEPFNVYAVSVDDGRVRRVTDSVSGATAPEVSPDGRRLLYLGYTVGGYDLFDIPYDPAAWRHASVAD